jgi:hypothetical protein
VLLLLVFFTAARNFSSEDDEEGKYVCRKLPHNEKRFFVASPIDD